LYFCTKPHPATHIVFVGAVIEVVQNLWLGSKHMAPAGVGLERERIQVGGHVAGGTGVAVVAPHAPHIIALFQQRDVVEPVFLQLYGHTQASKAGADDNDRLV